MSLADRRAAPLGIDQEIMGFRKCRDALPNLPEKSLRCARQLAGLADHRDDDRELVLHPMVDLAHEQTDAPFVLLVGADVARDLGAPTTRPMASRIGETVSETETSVPSLRRRIVS